jgi:hypothetical protein
MATPRTTDSVASCHRRGSVDVSVNATQVLAATNSKGKGASKQVWEKFGTMFVAVPDYHHRNYSCDPAREIQLHVRDGVSAGTRRVPSGGAQAPSVHLLMAGARCAGQKER